MKKALKINKTLIVLGIIVLISLISFLGLYEKVNGVWNNLISDYNFGLELSGYRELIYSLDTTEESKDVYVDENGNILGYVEDGTGSSQDMSIDLVQDEETESEAEEAESIPTETAETEYKTEARIIKANEDADITIENFELSKKIIQKRLKTIAGLEYNIRVDNITGDIVVEVPDDDNVSTEDALIDSKGSFDIIDEETGIVLLDNSDLANAKAVANTEEDGYQLYLQLTLNNSGKEKISEVSKKYVQAKNEAGEDTTKHVSVRFEGQALLTTYFGEEITNGVLTIPVGNPTTDSNEYSTLVEQATRVATILNEGELPLQYALLSDNFIRPVITAEIVLIFKIVFALVVLIISAILIVKYKLNGVILSVVSVGYVALTTLLLRYATVPLTLNSVYTLISCTALNYIFIIKLLGKLKENNIKVAYVQTMREYYLLIVPVIVLAVIFTFVSAVSVNSIGMTLFWGLLTAIVYNTFIIYTLKLV